MFKKHPERESSYMRSQGDETPNIHICLAGDYNNWSNPNNGPEAEYNVHHFRRTPHQSRSDHPVTLAVTPIQGERS